MSIHKRITAAILSNKFSNIRVSDRYAIDQLEDIAKGSNYAFWIATGHTLSDIGQTAPDEPGDRNQQ